MFASGSVSGGMGVGAIDAVAGLGAMAVLAVARLVLPPRYARAAWMLLAAGAGAGVAKVRLDAGSFNQAEAVLTVISLSLLGVVAGASCGLLAYQIAGMSHRWFQFRLRTLLIAVLALSAMLSWYSTITHRARQQRSTVRALGRLGGHVGYDWESVQSGTRRGLRPEPSWRRAILGDDYFDKVVRVDFAGRGATDEALRLLKAFPDLKTLSLCETQIPDASLKYIAGMAQLETLSLGETGVTDAALEHLKGLTSLQRLELSNTRVSDGGLVYLAGLHNLRILDLSHTQVSGAGLEHLKGLTFLQRLDLSNTHISRAGLEHLKGLEKLEELKLSKTQVNDAGLEQLVGWPNLGTLRLSLIETEVTEAALVRFMRATGLRSVSHSNTHLTEQYQKLRRQPFPWKPVRNWKVPGTPIGLDFMERNKSLIVLCERDSGRAETAGIMRCDFETGVVVSSHEIPFSAAAMAVSPDGKLLFLAGIIPSKDEPLLANRVPTLSSPRPHILRIALLRVSDWGTETEIEVEFEPTVSSFGLAESLRVLPLASRQAWIVGIGDPGKQAYRVWLRDLRTLAEIDSREVAGSLHPEEICLSLDARKPSSILATGAAMTADPIDTWPWGPSHAGSEHVLIGRPRHGDSSYLWDFWATNCSELVSAEVRMGLSGGVPPLPNGVDLSDCYVRWRESGALIAISPSGLCFARTGHGKLSNPAPAPTSYANRHWSDLEIWSLSPERSIAEGRVKDIDDFILTLRFSRDSKFLVTGHRQGDIRVWQLPDPLPN